MLKRKIDKELTIIIITYNSENIIEECLRNILHSKFNIIVVDNASTDNTVEISSRFPEIKILQPGKNLGYGRAANLGLKESSTRYTLLLNPDIKGSPYQIQELLDAAKKHKNTAAFAPLVTQKTIYDKSKPFEKVTWICGAVMLFDMKLLKKIGLFDENFFLFYEETDLCKRIVNAGHDIIRFNDQFLEHLECRSTTNVKPMRYARYWHTGWSHLYFTKKHESEKSFQEIVTKTISQYAKDINLAGNNEEKLMMHSAMLSGATAFLSGIKAIDDNGGPTVKP